MTNNGAVSSGVDTVDTQVVDAGILFDAGSGIPEDEQREILARINSIAEKNRQSLAEAAPGTKGRTRFRAKKSGGLFPVVVNVIALALLAGGFYLLSFFHTRTDTQVREGPKVYNSDERALIEEIRRETSTSIEQKENEITLIASKLDEVDAALQELHSNNQELIAEQLAAEQRLLALQEEYRSALSSLQDERSRILEEARMREASLQAQLEARARDFAAASEQSRLALEQRDAAIGAARSELERLSREQTQAANVEAQLSAFFENLSGQIRENRLTEAAATVTTMKAFVNTPAFTGLRSIQARKELYLRSINALEAMIAETIQNQDALAASGKLPSEETLRALAELQDRYSQQEKSIEDMRRSLSEGSDLGRQLADSQSMNSALNIAIGEKDREIDLLKAGAAEKDRSIETLRAEREDFAKTMMELRTENTQIQSSLNAASRELGELRPRVQTLTTVNTTLTNTINELTAQLNQPE
ncbi:MAG: hypothetical protein LBD48_12515 [Treponema sp.]|jgi:predicted  nucleic acid-binding Zn-ribbon protein|nr:hypothetical protein [Treponema sp.]